MSALHELARFGQSYWLDDLTRAMLVSGELERLVAHEGLTGVTSNPATFRAAIENSTDYDRQIEGLAAQPAHEIYQALVVADVRDACDVLRRVYDRTDGCDGFVSLEVSPHLARDVEGSLAEARSLWHAVARPNLLIKLPGTPEGVPAIEQLLFEGINVNVTLLFSIERYKVVALAHMRALERRAVDRAPLERVASVASFFLSRIDTLVDEQLHDVIRRGGVHADRLLGKVAVANAKLAYQRFTAITASTRWQSLESEHARPQRLLWASTSTKNKDYDELMYVEPLIGPYTVNTMPRNTMDAFAERGRATDSLRSDGAQAKQIIDELHNAGIDLARVTEQLLDDGIQKFVDAFDALMKTIEERRTR